MPNLSVATVQKAFGIWGYDVGPIDGIYGPQTALVMQAFFREYTGGPYQTIPSADKRWILIEPKMLSDEFKIGAAQWDAARPNRQPRATASAAAVVVAPLATPTTRSFWRWDSPTAWFAALLSAAAVGGLGLYGYRQGWFPR